MTLTTSNFPKPSAAPAPAQPTPAGVPIPADEEIIARPLSNPDFTRLTKKNKNVEFRWVNRAAAAGQRYRQALAQGYVNATSADVDVPTVAFENGAFINGDLILMKIDRKVYLGAIKFNEEEALRKVSPAGVEAKTKAELQKAQGTVSAPRDVKSKIQAFTPPIDSVNALTGDQK